jgi:hypothetical protein
MVIIYNKNGTVDLSATRECLTEPDEDTDEDTEGETPLVGRIQSILLDPQSEYEEFWQDPCWTQPPGPIG